MWGVRVLDVITWTVLIAGWFILDRLTRRRELKNALSSSIAETVRLVEDIEEFAIEFWLAPGSDRQEQHRQRARMIHKVNRLERRASDLRRRHAKLNLDTYLNALSKSVLDGDGEALDRKALSEDDPRMDRMMNAAKELIGKLDSFRN